jgi:hypothetical protein
MGETITLTDEDRTVLAALAEADGPAGVDALLDATEYGRERLRERLAGMADAGLARRADEGWAATASGRRAVAAPGDGSADQPIDTPAAVDEAIVGFDLRADREQAVRNAFGFLRFWGEAAASEIVDGVYEENPAGFESRGDWWEFVREHLAALPGVAQVEDGDGEDGKREASSETWRYEGVAGRAEDDGADGRRMLGVDAPTSAKHALAAQGLSPDEAAAATAALGVLQERGATSEREVTEAVFADHAAGYDDPEDWWRGFLREALRAVPAVERDDDGWRYVGRDCGEGGGSDARPDGGAEQAPEADAVGTDDATDADASDAAGADADASDAAGADADASDAAGADADTGVEAGDPCPVCGDVVSGRVFIRSDETVLSDDGLATCVQAAHSDEVAHPVLTLYYHRDR